MFSASASLACCLCSPLANAARPQTNTKGRLASPDNVTINEATDGSLYSLILTPINNLTYNGSDQQLISNAVLKYNGNEFDYTSSGHTLDLYLRVATDQTDPTNAVWMRMDSTTQLALVTAKDAGTYYIYYYVDAGRDTNLPDSGSET